MRDRLYTLLLIACVGAALCGQAAEAQLARNGRWLTYNGATPYLVGIDQQELAAEPGVDYIAKLNLLQESDICKVRIWLNNYFSKTALQPWSKMSNGKYNLDSWDPVFWSRMRSFVGAAQAREIIVEVSIFAPNNLTTASDFTGSCSGDTTKHLNIWNKNCNINGVFSPNSGGNFIPEFFDLNTPQVSTSGKRLRDYQQALLDKAVLELGGFGNVYFEVANEFPMSNVGNFCPPTPSGCGTYNVYKAGVACADDIDQVNWHQNWLNRLNATTPRLVTAHAQQGWGPNTTGMCHYWGMPAVDILNVHFYTNDPNTISNLWHAAQNKGKVLQNNESDVYVNSSLNLDAARLNKQTRFGWGTLMAGGYFGLYVNKPSMIGGTGWTQAAQRLKSLRTIAEIADFSIMSPIDGSGNEIDNKILQAPTGGNRQLIGATGQRFLAYFWCNDNACATTAPAQISLGSNRIANYTWYDVRSAAVLGSGTFSTGAGGTATPTIPSPAPSSYDANAGLALLVVIEPIEQPCRLDCEPPIP